MPSAAAVIRGTFGVGTLAVALVTAGCGDAAPTPTEPPTRALASAGGVPARQVREAIEAVLAGNAQAVAEAAHLVPPGVPLPPFVESRLYAITNVAMHDALNGIVPRFARYADLGPIDEDAAIAVAVLTAAHDAVHDADPGAASSIDAWYATALAEHANDDGYDAGLAIGHRAAAAILALRASDGTAGGGVAPYHPGSNPGDYQFTFPFNTPAFDFFGTGGFADATVWGSGVRPFVVNSTSQFRAAPPYGAASNAAAVLTPRYTSDFNEIKALGCADCSARTSEQTQIALFWVENSPTGWNRIARTVAADRQLDAWDTARLLALLQMGEFDAYATSLETKYHYNFWRPVTAVALAANDGNPDTSPAAGWEVLAFPTPPVPDYPSAHACAGGAAAAIIESLIPGHGRPFATSSGSLPGVLRTYSTVGAAAAENALSRVYVGYHFRHAAEVGLAQGRAVGAYVAANALSRR